MGYNGLRCCACAWVIIIACNSENCALRCEWYVRNVAPFTGPCRFRLHEKRASWGGLAINVWSIQLYCGVVVYKKIVFAIDRYEYNCMEASLNEPNGSSDVNGNFLCMAVLLLDRAIVEASLVKTETYWILILLLREVRLSHDSTWLLSYSVDRCLGLKKKTCYCIMNVREDLCPARACHRYANCLVLQWNWSSSHCHLKRDEHVTLCLFDWFQFQFTDSR